MYFLLSIWLLEYFSFIFIYIKLEIRIESVKTFLHFNLDFPIYLCKSHQVYSLFIKLFIPADDMKCAKVIKPSMPS